MPRKVRFILPNVPHHTIQRGNNRQNIFCEDEDFEYFLRLLYRQCEVHGVRTGAYCLMTNHIHLLSYPGSVEGMIKCMKSIGQFYTQYFNRKYSRSGKLWENRYKIQCVDPDIEWILARYIEKNPVRAFMVKRAEEYVYSSARYHLQAVPDTLVTKDILKGCGREGYIEFFHEDDSIEEKETQRINKRIEQCKAFGKETFIKKLKEITGFNVEYKKRGRPKLNK